MSTSKILSISLYALMGISVLLTLVFYVGLITEEPLIYWTYFLTIAAAIFAVVFPIIFMIKNPKGTKKVLAGLGVFLVFFLIAYLLASDEVLPKYEKYGITSTVSKNVGTGLFATYLLGLGAVVAIIYSGISQLFKR